MDLLMSQVKNIGKLFTNMFISRDNVLMRVPANVTLATPRLFIPHKCLNAFTPKIRNFPAILSADNW